MLKLAALMLSLALHCFAAVKLLHYRRNEAPSSAPELKLSLIEFSVSRQDQSTTPQSEQSDAPSASPPAPPTPDLFSVAPAKEDGVIPPPPPFEPALAELPQYLPSVSSSEVSAREESSAKEDQAQVDAPPEPLDVIRPKYPREARERGEEGDVTLLLTVSAKGEVKTVEIERSSGVDSLDRAAVAAVKAALFTPARTDGKATEAVAKLTLSFRLRR